MSTGSPFAVSWTSLAFATVQRSSTAVPGSTMVSLAVKDRMRNALPTAAGRSSEGSSAQASKTRENTRTERTKHFLTALPPWLSTTQQVRVRTDVLLLPRVPGKPPKPRLSASLAEHRFARQDESDASIRARYDVGQISLQLPKRATSASTRFTKASLW